MSDSRSGHRRRLSRRHFLLGGAALAAGGVAAAYSGLFDDLRNGNSGAAPGSDTFRAGPNDGLETSPATGYGRPGPARDLRDGVERLAVPEGFSYRSFGVTGTRMSDGYLTPLAHDGMAAFELPNGNTLLIRNHEDHNGPGQGSVTGSPVTRYDSLAGAGCTSLEINPGTRELKRDFISLNGTYANCGGGPTPWGSWLSCEETYEGPPAWRQPHGYVFEVSASAQGPVQPVPLKAMGRFVHEAAAVDPATSIVYETEDNGEASGFYRFLPSTPGRLADGGRLQMLAVADKPRYDTRAGQVVGQPLSVAWVDISDPDPRNGDPLSVWAQGFGQGAARFQRLEGCFFAEGSLFLHSTTGGNAGIGQVWQYHPNSASGGRLTLLFEATDPAVLKEPDNLAMSPRGGIVICGDGPGPLLLSGLTRKGEVFTFAVNLMNDSEWAGATFSPDGETLYVNIQGTTFGPNPPQTDAGITFAIWGPWSRGAL